MKWKLQIKPFKRTLQSAVTRFRGNVGISIVAETVGTTAVESHQYDVYGVPSSASNSLSRYTGQIQLKGTELYHYKDRAYIRDWEGSCRLIRLGMTMA